jgi:DNA-binding CsgD family transcriptional regulator/predicted ATPase
MVSTEAASFVECSVAPKSDAPASAPLIGRAEEFHRLLGLLRPDGPALINVTGTRGVGKSALVRSVLACVGHGFADVRRIDLTGESTASALLVLRRHLSHLPIPLRRAGFATTSNGSLLFLDRADVVAHAEQELVHLISGHTGVTVIVESVPQLRDPQCAVLLVDSLSTDAAAELFRRSAESVGVPLGSDETTRAHLQHISAAVDGNPLAIELAAARLPFLPLPALADALESPQLALSVLSSPDTGRSAGIAIRATVADSHHATSASAQRLLDLLSVFSGSFSIEAIEAVCIADVSTCFDALSELVDLRLVELDSSKGHGRYRLSRLVHDYAIERLAASSLEYAARTRHAAHYCDIARRASLAFDDADEESAQAILGEDYSEALAALRWVVDVDPPQALRLAADLGWEAQRRVGGDVLVEVMEQLTATIGTEQHRAARRDALLWLVQLGSWAPDASDRVELIRHRVDEGMALARAGDERLPLLRALRAQFLAVAANGDIRAAMQACTEGMVVAAMLGHARWLGRFEISLSAMHGVLREYEMAARLAASGLARAVRSEDRRGIALGILALHAVPTEHIKDRSAVPPLESALGMFREQGDVQDEIHTLALLAHAAIERGDAQAAARLVLARQGRLGQRDLLHGLTVSVMLAVHVARLRGEYARGARMHGSVACHVESLVGILFPVHAERYRSGLDTLREALGREEFDAAVAGGRLLERRGTLINLMRYLHEVVDEAGLTPEPAPPSNGIAANLTPREEQVLSLLALGLRNKEIATELGITPKSVMHHTVSIYRRLGVRSRTEAVTVAARQGVITLP